MTAILDRILVAVLQYPIVTVTWLFMLFLVVKPLRASDGRVSRTLTGLLMTTIIIFMITITDSINDQPIQSISKTTAVSNAKESKLKRLTRGRAGMGTPKARAVIKEKYGILVILWIGFACLYLLSHRGQEIQIMGLRFMMALRGKFNPMPNDDPLDNFLVSMLQSSNTDDNQNFAVELTLAKKGIVMARGTGALSSTSEVASTVVVDPGSVGIGSDEGRIKSDIPDFMKG